MLAFLRTFMRSRVAQARASSDDAFVARFGRDRKAAAAVEFALIAAPLVLMMCACVELAMVFMVSTTLENATETVSRGIRVGTITAANTSQAQFMQDICNNMGWLAGSCMSNLSVDVNTYTSFEGVPLSDPVKSGVLSTSLNYIIGTGSDIQEVRAYYSWPLFTPLLNPGLSTLSNGDALLSAKVIFRNEPF